jgi:hypothetical protein
MRGQPGRPFVRKQEPISSGDGLPRSRRELDLSRATARPSFGYADIELTLHPFVTLCGLSV